MSKISMSESGMYGGDHALPARVEITRGPVVESHHAVSVCVVDADGTVVLRRGDIAKPVFPRSAVKAIQALPLVESGAADAFGLTDQELALACSSHSAEPEHVSAARSMLNKAGLNESALECGGHWARRIPVIQQQMTDWDGTPGAICNNCSGKHAGFLCTAIHTKSEPEGYVHSDHGVQREIRAAMESLTGAVHGEDACGTDGCSIPTYAIGLDAMAHGFAKMATGVGLDDERRKAANRLLNACMAHPFYVAGTERFCTQLMALNQPENALPSVFAKTGAEGVFCGAIPALGLGIALKCHDGATRAAEAMMAHVVSHLMPKDDPRQIEFADLSSPVLKNWNGVEVGRVTPHL